MPRGVHYMAKTELLARNAELERQTAVARQQVVLLLRFIGGLGGRSLLAEAVDYLREAVLLETQS